MSYYPFVHIDSYIFGQIVIDGVQYNEDVLILPGGVRDKWWRAKGHEFSVFDLSEAFNSHPKYLILGIGLSGQCQVLKEVEDYCRAMDIELIVKSTPEAVVEFNSLEDTKSVAAALHLTC